jgi:hypothetical protein
MIAFLVLRTLMPGYIIRPDSLNNVTMRQNSTNSKYTYIIDNEHPYAK